MVNKKYAQLRKVNNTVQETQGPKSLSPEKLKSIDRDYKNKSVNWVKIEAKLNKNNPEIQYKPYTLRDYQSSYLGNTDKYEILGGLGPNQDQKCNEALRKAVRMRYFSSIVREKNRGYSEEKKYKLLHYKPKVTIKHNARFRALEFAKTIRSKKPYSYNFCS